MAEGTLELKNCWSSECEREEVMEKVVLRAVHIEENGKLVSEFVALNLNTGELCKTPFVLVGASIFSPILAVGSLIYTIGKPKTDTNINTNPNPNTNPNSHVQIHEGMSYFDLSKPEIGWTKVPICNEDQEYVPKYVSYCGKIYVFRNSNRSCFAQVFDPQLNCWNPLLDPPPINGDFQVGHPVLYDPSRSCLILYMFCMENSDPLSCIYAYYPAGAGACGRWECLDDNFKGEWILPVVAVDGVLYFYYHKLEELIEAYDLITKQWFKVVLSSKFELDLPRGFRFYGFQHLGNGVLCLMSFLPKLRNFDPEITKDHTVVYAVRFKVELRRSQRQVVVTPLSSVSCPLQNDCTIYDYLAI